MSSFAARPNSTNPRPGSTSFLRAPRGSNPLPPLRSATTGGHARTPSGYSPRPRASSSSSSGVNGATKTQVNQTFAINMMASPVNPLPFPLPIPIGIAMLLSPSGNNTSNHSPPRR
ncbi:hypothetical protein N656DRAFT_799636 [Canariomyces notabilis]|uniref:Uncharacterized protein n=1 Tax=Canariomyces notabilis TaxID=2074819 RepID=A0AAN6QML9_9PEZI|nr:hypothetical protein N656DRAFT_799636 [Canariomyces arenarius]